MSKEQELSIPLRKGFPCVMRRYSDSYRDLVALPPSAWEHKAFGSWLQTIPIARQNMTEADDLRENEGETPDDNFGYYRHSAHKAFLDMERKDYECSMSLPKDAALSIITCDVARGGQLDRRDSNDAAIVAGYVPLPKIEDGRVITGKPRVTWAWRARRVRKPQLSGFIHEIRAEHLKQTENGIVVVDYYGGGQDLGDALAEPKQEINGEFRTCVPIVKRELASESAPEVSRCLVYAHGGDPDKTASWEPAFGQMVGFGRNGWFSNAVYYRMAVALERAAFEVPDMNDPRLDVFRAFSRTSAFEQELIEHEEQYANDPDLMARANILLALRQILNIECVKGNDGAVERNDAGFYNFEKLSRLNTDLAQALVFFNAGALLLQTLYPADEPIGGGGDSGGFVMV